MTDRPAPNESSAEGSRAETDAREPLGRSITTVSGLTMISRVMGLARDVITARIFADTAVGSAFAAAFVIPNLFRRLFGEGALSAAFLPEYTRLVDDDPEKAGAFASLTIGLLGIVTGAVTVVGELGLLIAWQLSPPDPDRALSLTLIMVLLPYMPLICSAAILGGMLQAHRRFAPWAAAPMLLNACIIGAGIPYFFVEGAEARSWAYVVAVAAVVSGGLQMAWSFWALRGLVRWTRAVGVVRARTVAMMKRMGPVVIGLGTLQVNSLIDTAIAMWPNWVGPTIAGRDYPLDVASNSVLFYAQRLYQFPLGVFGVAVATVAFPAMSRAARDAGAFGEVLARGIRLALFITVPSSIGLALVRHDLAAVVYSGGGGFSAEGVDRAAAVLLGYAWAVWAFSLNQVLTRSFFARDDTATPMKIAMGTVGLNLALNLTLIWPLQEAGLAWSTAISATVQTALLWVAARRGAGGPVLDGATRRAILGTVLASVAMGACVWGVVVAWGERGSWAAHAGALGSACVAGVVIYMGWAAATGRPEVRSLIDPIARRVRRDRDINGDTGGRG